MKNLKTARPLLIFSEGISYGHIARSLIFANWLKQLNYPILVACTNTSSSLFRAEGFETINIEIANPKKIYQRLCKGTPMYTKEELLKYFEQDDYLIKQIEPRMVISEFRFTALQLAKKSGIPSVGLTDATCHPNFVPDKTVPDPFVKPHFIPLWLLDFIAQKTIFGAVIDRQVTNKISTSLREASLEYGLEQLDTFFDYASQGDICLICDHPDLIPINPLRSGDIYTGAMLWERHEPLPSELSRLNVDRKTVYVCPGTQESLPIDFLILYIQKLLSHNVQVIVSRGKRDFELKIDHHSLFVFDFVNESKLLSQVDIMVYPGGAMSTYQALSCGVPLIVLPAHANQHFYGEAIVKNNLGYLFRPSRLKINRLIEVTLKILDNNSIYERVFHFKQKISSFNNRPKILNRIKDML